jgi:hypothetical protein
MRSKKIPRRGLKSRFFDRFLVYDFLVTTTLTMKGIYGFGKKNFSGWPIHKREKKSAALMNRPEALMNRFLSDFFRHSSNFLWVRYYGTRCIQ